MAEQTALTVDERLRQLLGHLGIDQAHFACRFAQDWTGLAAKSPEVISSLTVVGGSFDPRLVEHVAAKVLAVSYCDPLNMPDPFGAYVCVVDIDVDTEIRRFYGLDDNGTRINPMIIECQVRGGLTEALAIVMGREMDYARTAI